MKSFDILKRLGIAMLFLGLFGVVSAQSPSNLQLKQEQEQMSGANYDIWKASVSTNEVEPNKLVTTSINNGYKTYLVRLGWNLLNSDSESVYEVKLRRQPGVISVDADFQTNTVELTVKEEDEHDALKSYFDIQ